MANPFEPYKAPTAVDTEPLASAQAAVSDVVLDLLVKTRPWVKLMAVLAFVFLGLSVVVGLVISVGRLRSATTFIPVAVMGLVYTPAGLFLWRYAGSIGQLRAGGGQAALETAMRYQKSFWKYLGIVACVMIALQGLAVVVGIVTGLASSRGGG